MRPKYLEIEGLQSFKELQTVDFEELGETGLFGIFGPTGSGKSTILDAITLALYGNVQRANWGTQGIINTDSNSVSICFIFELLKDNKRRIYKATRLYKRKKGNDNSTVSKMARLFEVVGGEDVIIADKEREVTSSVIDIIGLSPDDFTRSVVLPQNKFMEFLILNKSDKRDMMERIFYLEEYGRNLSDKLARRLSNIRYKLSNIEGAMSALGDISEKVLLEAEAKFKEMREYRDICNSLLAQKEEQFIRAKGVWELTSEKTNIGNMLNHHLNSIEEINQKKRKYENAVKAEGLIGVIRKHKEISDKLDETQNRLYKIDEKLPEIQIELKKMQNEYTRKAEEEEINIPVLIEKRSRLNDALEIKKQIITIDAEYKEVREKYLSIRKQKDEREKEIEGQKAILLQMEKTITESNMELQTLNVDLNYRKRVFEVIKIEESAKINENDFKEKDQITKGILKKFTELMTKYGDGQYGEANLINEREYDAIANSVLEEIKRLEILIKENTARILSRGLMDGTPCPVCGSKEHPAIAGHAKGMDECEDNEDDKDNEDNEDNEDDKDIDNLSVKLKKQMEFLAELSANRGNIIKAQGTLRDAHLKTIDSKRILSGYLEELGIKNASEEYARLELNEHKSQKLRIEIDNRRLENEKVRKEIEVTIEKLQNINNKLSEIEAVGKNLKSQKDERETRIKNIAGENDINVEIISVEQRMEKLRNEKKQLFDSVNVLQQKLNELVISKETYENQLSIYLQAVKDESERLECELNRKGFDGIDEAVNSIINEDDKRQLSSQIEEYEEKAKGLTIQIGTIDKKLNGEILTREDWLKISADFNTARKNKEESISLFEKAKGQYEHTLKNFEKWLVLNMENKKYNYKKDMLQDIQRLLKGNGFVEFISEERLRYIAREATETLEVLSNYRYALELDVENGFVIRDNANGGAIRLVSTLSGGETFLTSLSLALALSKQIQLKGQSPLEFFFLDEGFGTLDIDLLDTVIDALERLSNTSRVIGLISHVPELKNRIMRKLIVTQPNLGKGSRITIERA